MKFLVDVNASGPVARWLVDAGHDVTRVSERNPRLRDEEILRWAVRDQRIIVTTDQDLENLFGGMSEACDFVDLVQKGFCVRPVAPLQGLT